LKNFCSVPLPNSSLGHDSLGIAFKLQNDDI
jgi:hypothetical protein